MPYYASEINAKKVISDMRKMMHPFVQDASILVSVGVFLTHRFEAVGDLPIFLRQKRPLYVALTSNGRNCVTVGLKQFYDF